MAGLLRGVGVLLGGVDRVLRMLGRAVHGVQDQRVGARVAEVVHGPRRDGHQVALDDLSRLASHLCLADAADEGEELVGPLVRLLPDLAAGRDGHDDELGVLASPQDSSEVGVLLGNSGDGEVVHVGHGVFRSVVVARVSVLAASTAWSAGRGLGPARHIHAVVSTATEALVLRRRRPAPACADPREGHRAGVRHVGPSSRGSAHSPRRGARRSTPARSRPPRAG